MIVASLGLIFAVTAAPDYQLKQSIDPIVCTSTTIVNGPSLRAENDCDQSYTPILSRVIVNDKQLKLVGKFDSNQARVFKIHVFGRTYQLGQSPELTTNGDDWWLDLSSLRAGLKPGVYDVVLEMLTENSLLYEGTIKSRIEIPIRPVSPDTVKPQPDKTWPQKIKQSLEAKLADTGTSFYVALGGAVSLLIVAGILYAYRRRRG